MGALEKLAVFTAGVRLKHAQARERDDPRTLPSHSSAIPAANLRGKGNEQLGQPVERPGLPQGLPVWPDRRRDFFCSPKLRRGEGSPGLRSRHGRKCRSWCPSARPLEFQLLVWGGPAPAGRNEVVAGRGGART